MINQESHKQLCDNLINQVMMHSHLIELLTYYIDQSHNGKR